MDPSSHIDNSAGRKSLAYISLTAGILSVISSFVLVGGVFGIVGLFIGSRHLGKQRKGAVVAWAGILLSAIGIGATVGFAVVYYPTVQRKHESRPPAYVSNLNGTTPPSSPQPNQ